MLLFMCSVILGLLFTFSIVTRAMSKRISTASSDPSDSAVGRTSTACAHGESYDTWRRTSFEESLEGEGCRIFAWPSRGGVIIKNHADAVEMMFLGFDRFEPPTHRYPADEQEKEDAFARELRKVGGKLWQSQHRNSQVERGREEPEGEERMYRAFGWEPADGGGGVWELAFDDCDNLVDKRVETARLRMAITMEERCIVLKRLGATFYQDPRECEGLREAYPPYQ